MRDITIFIVNWPVSDAGRYITCSAGGEYRTPHVRAPPMQRYDKQKPPHTRVQDYGPT